MARARPLQRPWFQSERADDECSHLWCLIALPLQFAPMVAREDVERRTGPIRSSGVPAIDSNQGLAFLLCELI